MTVQLHRDLRTIPRVSPQASGLPDGAGFTNENALPVELPEKGPLGDPWLRQTLVDGQTGAGSAMPNERADCTFGAIALGERRIVDWIERTPEPLPSTTLDRWQVMGPEIHGPNVSTFPQALVMLEVGPDKRRRLNANAGRSSVRYRDLGAIVEDDAYSMRLDVHLTAGADGWVEVARVNLRTGERTGARIDGASIAQAIAGSYFKEALYRNARINGRWTFDVTSMRVLDAELGDELPPMLGVGGDGTPTPPPPPAADTTAPRVTLTVGNDCTWRVDLPDADTARVLVGVAGTAPNDPFPPTEITGAAIKPVVTGTFDRTRLVFGEQRWAWAIAWDAAGNTSPPSSRPFTPIAVDPPPPPAGGPTQADLDAAVARAAAAEAKLATVRTDVAAETQRHATAIASALG